jgi:mRNA interferase RelE/StbE
MYRITLTRSAFKELHSLPNEVIKRISEKIDLLAETPRPPGSKKLKGTSEDLWRIRIGDYRVI